MDKHFFLTALSASLLLTLAQGQEMLSDHPNANSIAIAGPAATTIICTDSNDYALIGVSANMLQHDLTEVTGSNIVIRHSIASPADNLVIIGTLERSALIKDLVKRKKISAGKISNKWEAFLVQQVANPFPGIKNALVIAGSDRRGAAYGVAELSQQLGVSPWYWWADVPVQKKKQLYIARSFIKTDSPHVKYRGIFLNDEAPALSGWTREKFGGFTHGFYEKVFELLIRLKANYLWPAMWGNAFYDDDSLNRATADRYGIVIGTSHHEPLMRAHDEWRRYGSGKWNYDSNANRLKAFWKTGMERATNEKIVTVGMRGDGDEPMSRETAVALLEKIVTDQRRIIEEVTKRPALETPQLWALYKEVQDYYDKGMRVPDDITLLLCDDNWGNIRRLPALSEKPRKGGYGIYYHFDYVGGPRNYKWINTNPIPRIWEQMHLAWEYNVRQIWVVNVGDLKPMEFPIQFFLDYAWDPARIQAEDLQNYTEQWAARQFGNDYAKDIASILSQYAKFNGRRKPELLDANTYSLTNYDEAQRVSNEWITLLQQAERIDDKLPAGYRDAYFQLVLHPVKASANLQQLYTAVAQNRFEAARSSSLANQYADRAKQYYVQDSLITAAYHALGNGKWNHMMDQTHIGYTYWQQPMRQKMPEVKYVGNGLPVQQAASFDTMERSAIDLVPAAIKKNLFYEKNGYVSIEADHFTQAFNTNGISWKIIPGLGKTGSAVTPFPVTAATQTTAAASPYLAYEVYVYDTGKVKLDAYFSPTLNLHNTPEGLQYAISIDNELPQIISINKEDRNTGSGIWNSWVANNVIIKTSGHTLLQPGKHIIKYRMVHPGVVLQKLVLDFGAVKQSYLGPPETRKKQ